MDKYLSRSIDQALLEWKDNPRRKPLLVRGARQVGKSSTIRHLGKNFKYFLEVNVERNPEVMEFFKGSRDVKSIAAKLSDFFNVPVVPGETLFFSLMRYKSVKTSFIAFGFLRKIIPNFMSLLQVRSWSLR